MLDIRTLFHNKQIGKTLIRLLLLQKQSDLGQHCLPRPFGWATDVRNFRTFIILFTFFMNKILVIRTYS